MMATRLASLVLLCGTLTPWIFADELRIAPTVLTVIDESQVAAEAAGVITQVCVEVGQQVTAGTRLAQLDDRDAQLEVERARLDYELARQAANDVDVRYAKEALTLAELDLQRARDAVDRYAKSVSGAQIDRLQVMVARARLDVERAERDVEAARLAVDAAQNGLKIAERGMERRQILAPIDGTVVAIEVRRGESVELGKAVFRIMNIDRLRAEAFVEFDRLAGDVQTHDVTFAARVPPQEDAAFSGRLTFVSPEVNRVNGQVRVWAEIDNREQRLRPGITGTLIIHTLDSQRHIVPPPSPSLPSQSPSE